MQEIWKEIIGFPGYYISSKGQLWSEKSRKILSQHLSGSKNKYYKVSLYLNGKPFEKFVHRLVLSTFKPVEDMDKLTVNHIDEDPYNNRLENLEWMTLEDNIRYSSGQCIRQETIEGEVVAEFPSVRAAARSTCIDTKTMLRHCNNGTPYKNFYWKKVDNPRKI